MTRRPWSLAVPLAACTAVVLLPSGASARSIGLGVGVDAPGVPLASDLALDRDPVGLALSVPVLVGGCRLEPQLSFSFVGGPDGRPSGHVICNDALTGGCRDGITRESRRTSLALGAGPVWSLGDDLRAWAGPWAALVFRSVSSEEEVERDWSLGAGLGGEWFLDRFLSVGADLRLAYTSVQQGNRTRLEPTSGWILAADGVLALRVYLD